MYVHVHALNQLQYSMCAHVHVAKGSKNWPLILNSIIVIIIVILLSLVYTLIVLKMLKPFWAVLKMTPGNCGCQCSSLISSCPYTCTHTENDWGHDCSLFHSLPLLDVWREVVVEYPWDYQTVRFSPHLSQLTNPTGQSLKKVSLYININLLLLLDYLHQLKQILLNRSYAILQMRLALCDAWM